MTPFAPKLPEALAVVYILDKLAGANGKLSSVEIAARQHAWLIIEAAAKKYVTGFAIANPGIK